MLCNTSVGHFPETCGGGGVGEWEGEAVPLSGDKWTMVLGDNDEGRDEGWCVSLPFEPFKLATISFSIMFGWRIISE